MGKLWENLGNLLKGEEEYDENEEYEGEEYEEIEEAVEKPAPAVANKPAPASRPTGGISSAALEMKVIKPERFDEVRTIGDHLLAKRTVVLNLEDTNKETTKRIIDFLCGVAFAIGGNVQKVANATYVVTPKNVDVMEEQNGATVEEQPAANVSKDFLR